MATDMHRSIDLHLHSSFSDGTFHPKELVAKAQELQLTAISLTDHDTISGIDGFLSLKNHTDVELLPGIELSTYHPLSTSHILGYGLDHNSTHLQERLREIQAARERRNKQIIKNLNNMGVDISIEEARKKIKGQIGRPHIASLLRQKGIVKSENEAFVRFLKKGGPAYAEREQLPAEDAISLIKKAGGISVLAHPATMDPTCIFLPQFIRELADKGLDGIEVYHPSHNEKHIHFFKRICAELHLLSTGGSDFHGRDQEKSKMGYYGKKKPIAEKLWFDLKKRLVP